MANRYGKLTCNEADVSKNSPQDNAIESPFYDGIPMSVSFVLLSTISVTNIPCTVQEHRARMLDFTRILVIECFIEYGKR